MYRTFRTFLGMAMIVPLITVASVAQAVEDGPQTVKIALLDMSSIAGPAMGPGGGAGFDSGTGPGQGTGKGPAMGPGGAQGMGLGTPPGGLGRGPGMGPTNGFGPGMMGPGWGWGGGQGSGWMAKGMMGPGMMGMGMMSIRTGTTAVKPGKVRFEVTNYSASIVHELEVVAVDDLNAPLPYDYNKAKVVVDKSRSRGEVEDVSPGNGKVLELTLPAGNYLLICNLPGHYAAGMVAPFTIAP